MNLNAAPAKRRDPYSGMRPIVRDLWATGLAGTVAYLEPEVTNLGLAAKRAWRYPGTNLGFQLEQLRDDLEAVVKRAQLIQGELAGDACPFDDADECSTARERSVAGVANVVPGCPVHP